MTLSCYSFLSSPQISLYVSHYSTTCPHPLFCQCGSDCHHSLLHDAGFATQKSLVNSKASILPSRPEHHSSPVTKKQNFFLSPLDHSWWYSFNLSSVYAFGFAQFLSLNSYQVCFCFLSPPPPVSQKNVNRHTTQNSCLVCISQSSVLQGL